MTTWKKSEKEIIKAIVRYGGEAKSLGEVLNKSKLLENRGIGIVQYGGETIIFLRSDKYNAPDDSNGLGYVAELLSLIDTLIRQKLIVMIPFCIQNTLVIGAENSKWLEPEIISVNGTERIYVAERNINWVDSNDQQKYMHCVIPEQKFPIGNIFNMSFSVSEELNNRVKHKFKSEEDLRFCRQQIATWVSIFIAITIGFFSIYISLVK